MKRVVLCRPSGPRNAGLVLRTATNFGPCELYFAAPEKPSLTIHPEFEMMSHGVGERAAKARVVADLDAALAECHWVVGFTARVRDHRVLRSWKEIAPELARRSSSDDERVALVFGNEVSGMTVEEGDRCHELVRIETGDEHTSLNLAMSVGVVLAALFEREERGDRPQASGRLGEAGGKRRPNAGTRSSPISQAERAYLIAHVGEALGDRALSAPAKRDILASVERVFARAPVEGRDARAWHAIMRALGNRKAPSDYGLADQARQVRRTRAAGR